MRVQPDGVGAPDAAQQILSFIAHHRPLKKVAATRCGHNACCFLVGPSNMAIIFLLVLLGAMGFSIVLPSIMFVAEEFGGGQAMAGWIVASYAIGQLIATPIWGRLSDRYGRKMVLAICSACTMVAFLGLAFAYDAGTLFVSRFIGGLAGGLFSVSQAWVADTTTPKNRAKGMGIMGAGISLGFILGPFVGGLLGGETAETASLFLPGLLGAALAAVLLVAIVIFMRESLPPEKRMAPQPLGAELRQWRAIGARPVVKRLLILGLLWMTAAGMFEVMMPLWVGDTLDWGPRHVGLQFLFLGLLVAVVQGLIAGRLSIRFGEVAVIAAGIVLYAVGLMLIANFGAMPAQESLMIGSGVLRDFSGQPWLVLGLGLLASGSALLVPNISSLVSKYASVSERGTVLGLFQSSNWMGRTISPPIGGMLFQSQGANAPLFGSVLVLVPCLLGLLIWFGGSRAQPRKEVET